MKVGMNIHRVTVNAITAHDGVASTLTSLHFVSAWCKTLLQVFVPIGSRQSPVDLSVQLCSMLKPTVLCMQLVLS